MYKHPMSKNTTTSACNNCGKQGHMFHQCKLPITSYGVIAFRESPYGAQYLMIRRKDSFGYIDFVRGKYSPYNLQQMMAMLDEMSVAEKARITETPFETLWNDMWGDVTTQFKSEEYASKKKFDTVTEGVSINGVVYALRDMVRMSHTAWKETEWEFPKGRRNQKEKDVDCALREFEEETGIDKHKLTVVENVLPFEETFIGSNYKSYKHKYFLASVDPDCDCLHNFQVTEVSKLEWKTIDECVASIRPYHLEKKELIVNINKVLQEYRLYS